MVEAANLLNMGVPWQSPKLWVCMQAWPLVAHLLQQRSPRHLTLNLLHAMEALLRAVGPSEALHTAVMQRLLLNLRLWAAAPLPIQRSFQALLLKLAKVAPLRPMLSC